jgi:pyruvate kinase
MIAALFAAGADVFRINMSHTSHERMRELVRMIRDVEVANGRPIGVLVDLQGPKLRVGTFKEDAVLLAKGADFVLDADPAPGDQTRVHLPHPEILSALEPGHTLLLDDGKIRLTAIEVSPQRALTRVEVGGKRRREKASACPTPWSDFPRSPARTIPISKPPSMPAPTGSRCPSSSGPTTSPMPRRSPAGAPR